MVRKIVKDPIFLAQKSVQASEDDLCTARDLKDTLAANADRCVGMAANMIGELKRIIAFDDNGTVTVMFNPEIIEASGKYQTEEGCLSLSGTRTAVRYRCISVEYQDFMFQTKQKKYTGWAAQIIQHEIDHCNGILI